MKKVISIVLLLTLTFNLFSLMVITKDGKKRLGEIKKANAEEIYFVETKYPDKLLIFEQEIISSIVSDEKDIITEIFNDGVKGRINYNSFQEVINVELNFSKVTEEPEEMITIQEEEKLEEPLIKVNYNESFDLGYSYGLQHHPSGGWGFGGFTSGFLLGIIGAGLHFAIASGSSPETNYIPENVEPLAYRNGFEKAARKKNKKSSITGGLLGTATVVVLFLMTESNK
ncbi:MAG: hypothetical protein KAS53_00235 [Candidatus Cloacimonetes bacterium]|nr:hypothetical protein [Candidatus Cloacimonadota bacterium]